MNGTPARHNRGSGAQEQQNTHSRHYGVVRVVRRDVCCVFFFRDGEGTRFPGLSLRSDHQPNHAVGGFTDESIGNVKALLPRQSVETTTSNVSNISPQWRSSVPLCHTSLLKPIKLIPCRTDHLLITSLVRVRSLHGFPCQDLPCYRACVHLLEFDNSRSH